MTSLFFSPAFVALVIELLIVLVGGLLFGIGPNEKLTKISRRG